MYRSRCALLIITSFVVTLASVASAGDSPSRPAEKGCKWEKLRSPALGLDAWVQRCDFGFRRIDFLARGSSLAIRYSDGGEPEPVIDVLDLHAGESAEAGLKRIFRERTDPAIAKRCVLAKYEDPDPRPGATRYTFVPDEAYQKELNAKSSDEGGVPEPPCGDLGDQPDGIQYFEVQPGSGANRVLFVRVGQDVPLFDEQSLRLLPDAKR